MMLYRSFVTYYRPAL